MTDLLVKIPDEVLETYRRGMGRAIDPEDFILEAMTLFNWAVFERARGKLILSAEADGRDMRRLRMPSLDGIRPGAAG